MSSTEAVSALSVDEDQLAIAPGSIVLIRDEEWLVSNVEQSSDGWFIDVIGTSGITRDQEARFSTALDHVEVVDPRQTLVVADTSPRFVNSRLWLESLVQRTPVPVGEQQLVAAQSALVDPLPYQKTAVERILNPEIPRPRLLLADTVGLGKTIEIGMILSELVRRGCGERILVVTPKHVLEQMQAELWNRFALPFVRLDSLGIQHIRQTLPAGRNPFTYYKRVIISIDTLKSDQYIPHLRAQKWDAVVIDESHNVTNTGTQNNRLAELLSRNTDALILASATPHNGNASSFNELIRMLEPSAVSPDGELDTELVKKLVVRRHRNSDEVKAAVGGEWAERLAPDNREVPASSAENAVAEELEHTWLWPESGKAPTSSSLFPWTLAKAFLSSAAALDASIQSRLKTIRAGLSDCDPDARETSSSTTPELAALERLASLNHACTKENQAKYAELLAILKDAGVGAKSTERAVIFAERVPTLMWLQKELARDLKFKSENVRVLHGGLSDIEQQEIVESFKLESSPIRLLVTGDIASEGVNLHSQCHRLIHYDIPWSLIRIEQRNGRIDRYGQRQHPQITTLLLSPTTGRFSGDFRVLTRLIEREHEAHEVLGDAGSLIGTYDVRAEEDAIAQVIRGAKQFDDVVRDTSSVTQDQGPTGLLAQIVAMGQQRAEQEKQSVPAEYSSSEPTATGTSGLFSTEREFLGSALSVITTTPTRKPPNGVAWDDRPEHSFVSLKPPPDLQQRLEVLPQAYLKHRKVLEKINLVTTKTRGNRELEQAKEAGSNMSWPEAQYLSAQHPVMEWAEDRVLATLQRNKIYAVPGGVEFPTILVLGTLLNARGQIVASSYAHVVFPSFDASGDVGHGFLNPYPSAAEAIADLDLATRNRGLVEDGSQYVRLIPQAIDASESLLESMRQAAEVNVTKRIDEWVNRTGQWRQTALEFAQTKRRRTLVNTVEEERQYLESLRPAQTLVRPLIVVVPKEES